MIDPLDCDGLGHRKAPDSVAIGWSRVVPDRELVIECGDLVQPIDDPFVGHRGCVATSPLRFFSEERGISRNRGVRRHLIHTDLTFARRGAIHPTERAYCRNSGSQKSPLGVVACALLEQQTYSTPATRFATPALCCHEELCCGGQEGRR